jgi:hypothetical protein
MPTKRPSTNTESSRANLTIPELEHAKAAALGTLISLHSRRAYKNAIDKFIAWYCSEPRIGFNRANLGVSSLSARPPSEGRTTVQICNLHGGRFENAPGSMGLPPAFAVA